VSDRLFDSFFIGGFECSTLVRRDGVRLDLLASTQHDRFALADYRRLRAHGIGVARDGVRWHLAERRTGVYDWSSFLPMLDAARESGVLVIWDLLHFGWPSELDVFSNAFVDRFESFARAFARVVRNGSDQPLFVAPLNEPSFLAFAAGEKGFFSPFAQGRGDDIKRQFARAIIAACHAIRDETPNARLVHTDPIINVIADPRRPQDRMAAEGHRQAMFAAWDMIAGRTHESLGGSPAILDILGLNYYIHNQWVHEDGLLLPTHPSHLPLRWMLREVHERYARPMFLAETGIEADARPVWLRYVSREVRAAIGVGVPFQGICLYPIVDHPGWDDDRHCPNGVFGYADGTGHRPVAFDYARELLRQQALFDGLLTRGEAVADESSDLDADRERFDVMERQMLDVAARDMREATERLRV
jgi:hypothetical protein